MTVGFSGNGRDTLGYACKTCGSIVTIDMRKNQVYLEVPTNMQPCDGCTQFASRRAEDFLTTFTQEPAPAFTPMEEETETEQATIMNIEGVHTWFYNQE